MERWQTLLDALRPKQRRFVEAVIENGGNLTRAAKSAGYNCTNENSFAKMGLENSRKPKIRDAIDAYERHLHAETEEKVLYTREKAIKEYDEMLEVARAHGQAGSGCTAIAGKVALCGLAIKDQENPANHRPMTREELEAALAELDEMDAEADVIQMQVNKRVG